jgi:hypothetical protein
LQDTPTAARARKAQGKTRRRIVADGGDLRPSPSEGASLLAHPRVTISVLAFFQKRAMARALRRHEVEAPPMFRIGWWQNR